MTQALVPLRHPRLTAVASFAAAALLGLALATTSVWQGTQGTAEHRIGLLRMVSCVADRCGSTPLAELGAERWARLGLASFVAAAFAALAQGMLAWATLRGRDTWAYRPRWAAFTALFALSLGAVFVTTEPGLELRFGPGLWLYFGGAAVAVGAAIALHRGGANDGV